MIPRAHCVCADDFALLPSGLRARLSQAKNYGIDWKCHPTQEYLDVRSQVIAYVNRRRAAESRRDDDPEQLSLLPT